jgi:hypothetical protein
MTPVNKTRQLRLVGAVEPPVFGHESKGRAGERLWGYHLEPRGVCSDSRTHVPTRHGHGAVGARRQPGLRVSHCDEV